VGVTIVQASAYVGISTQTSSAAIIPGFSVAFLLFQLLSFLPAGTLVVMWMGEKITDKGLGNGVSLIIMIGILARLPQSFTQELVA
jgi:preprotein translocase subunit SecY